MVASPGPRVLGQTGCRVPARTLDRRRAPELRPLPPALSPPFSFGKGSCEFTPNEDLHIYDSKIRRIILVRVNSTIPRVGNLALSLPAPSSAAQRPDLLNHGEQKGGGQPEQKHPIQRLQSTHELPLLFQKRFAWP
jgi:hypothetical protein